MRIGLEYFQEHDVTLVLVDNGARTVAFVAEGQVGYDKVLTIGDVETVEEYMITSTQKHGCGETIELAISLINKLTEKVNWAEYIL